MIPTLGNYIDSVNNPDIHFKTLSKAYAIRLDNGSPRFTISSKIVRFDINFNGKCNRLCCFLSNYNVLKSRYKTLSMQMEVLSSKYLTNWNYLENEMLVFDERGNSSVCDVILQEEPRGETLDAFIRRCCLQTEGKSLRKLMLEVCNMAVEFYDNRFVHGAINPNNIIVTPDIMPVLINYRSARVISKKAAESAQGGIDDDNINLAVLAIILWIVSYKPYLYVNFKGIMAFRRPSLRLSMPELYEFAKEYTIEPLKNIVGALIASNDRLRDRAQLNRYLLDLYNCNLEQYVDVSERWHNNRSAKIAESAAVKTKLPLHQIDTTKYYFVGAVSDTLIRVCDMERQWFYLNKNGSLAFDAVFQIAEDFVEGRAVVMVNDCYGLIDRENRFIIEPVCEDLVWYGECGIAVTALDGRYSLRNRMGEAITPIEYDWIGGVLTDGLMPAMIDAKHGYLNTFGAQAIEFIYDDAYSFDNGTALVVKDGKEFEIDRHGIRI